ncbi:hypothetical protein SDC9_178715 [bioreactor metagenome]|uniref:Uncharacterized protein n=1 Tax=bioreactor metagenome TaxID=1076179 RepID=A0A645GWG8_9ZZZZ
MDVLQGNDPLPAALRLGEFEIELWTILFRGFNPVHALDLFELGLSLCGLGILGPETVDEIHQTPDFALLMFINGQELLFVGLALFQVIVVIAAVTNEFALADFNHAADQLI